MFSTCHLELVTLLRNLLKAEIAVEEQPKYMQHTLRIGVALANPEAESRIRHRCANFIASDLMLYFFHGPEEIVQISVCDLIFPCLRGFVGQPYSCSAELR